MNPETRDKLNRIREFRKDLSDNIIFGLSVLALLVTVSQCSDPVEKVIASDIPCGPGETYRRETTPAQRPDGQPDVVEFCDGVPIPDWE